METPPPVQGFLEEGAPAEIGHSVVDLLKQDLREVSTTREVYIRIPGFEKSGLQAKYRLPEPGELAAITRKVERNHKDTWERNLYGAMDTIIALCDGLYVQPEGVEQPVMLDYENTGIPCRFDHRLAEYIGLSNGAEPPTARIVLKKLFKDRELAVINHGEKLSRWLVDANADVNREFWQPGE
jgi:hypothetical protein